MKKLINRIIYRLKYRARRKKFDALCPHIPCQQCEEFFNIEGKCICSLFEQTRLEEENG